MNASYSVPMKASTNGRRKEFAITIAQSQRAKCVRRSNNPSKVINIRSFRDKHVPTFGKTIRNCTSLQDGFKIMKEKLRAQTTSTPADAVGNSITEPDQWSNWCHQERVEHIAKNIFMLVMPRALCGCQENYSGCGPLHL